MKWSLSSRSVGMQIFREKKIRIQTIAKQQVQQTHALICIGKKFTCKHVNKNVGHIYWFKKHADCFFNKFDTIVNQNIWNN